jgi:hypothetical protein
MSRFEFNSVLVSIMLAFAAAQLVTAWGRVIRAPGRFGFSWEFTLLSTWLLLSLILHWFGLWAYREVPFDTALQSFLVLLPALVLALLTHILTPDADAQGPGALHQHYLSVSRVALPLCGLFMLLSGFTDIALPDVLYSGPVAYFVVAATSLAALAFTSRTSVHALVLGANAIAACLALTVSPS